MTLKDLIAKTEHVDLKICGEQFKARVLSSADLAMLHRLLPEPQAPMKKEPGKGMLSLVPDEHDPDHRRAIEQWWVPHCVDCVAVAIGKHNPAQLGLDATVGAWPQIRIDDLGATESACRDFLTAAREVVSNLPHRELMSAAMGAREGGQSIGDVGGSAEKN